MRKQAGKPHRPRRPRNAVRTRADILEAAISRFSDAAYENVGLRSIAHDAGIDVSLIARYFGSKKKLYLEVLGRLVNHALLISGERSNFGMRIASHLLAERLADVKEFESVLLVVRAASSPTALPILKRLNNERFIRPLAEWLGGKDAELRAHFIASLITGEVVTRNVAAAGELAAQKKAKYIKRLAAVLQGLVDDR